MDEFVMRKIVKKRYNIFVILKKIKLMVAGGQNYVNTLKWAMAKWFYFFMSIKINSENNKIQIYKITFFSKYSYFRSYNYKPLNA